MIKNHSGGTQLLLSEKQREKLAQALKLPPSDGGIWTGLKVARWIDKETGIEKVWNQRGWDYLKKCNYSWQRPRPKHRTTIVSKESAPISQEDAARATRQRTRSLVF